LDPNIDYAYKQHYQEHILPSIQSKTQPLAPEHQFKHIVPIGNEYVAPPAADTNREDPLRALMDEFLSDEELGYLPRLEHKPVAIAKLPNEIMLHVVSYLALHSLSSIPFFALTCKKFLLYSRDPTVWQYACTAVFKEPYMTLADSKIFQASYVKKYNGNWLRMFVDRPRIRFDGVYISTCHYIR
jgi:F-box protein 9